MQFVSCPRKAVKPLKPVKPRWWALPSTIISKRVWRLRRWKWPSPRAIRRRASSIIRALRGQDTNCIITPRHAIMPHGSPRSHHRTWPPASRHAARKPPAIAVHRKGRLCPLSRSFAERCKANGVACWAYCLMPNHVHLILTPQSETGLSRAVGEAHRRYTAFFNARARVTGHLFQGRFSSTAMDEPHLMSALRCLALNPVHANMVARAKNWPHSSVPAHLAGKGDALVDVAPVLERAPRFRDLLDPSGVDPAMFAEFDGDAQSGRPLGDVAFVDRIEGALGRSVRPMKRGRKPAFGGEG